MRDGIAPHCESRHLDGPLLAPTKTRRSHRVALDPATVALLGARFDEVASSCPEGVEDAFVFSSESAGLRPWNPNWVTKEFIAARKRAGVDHFRLHDLRHFMATQMLGAGVAVPVVSARLAHARASTTLNVYAHAIPSGDVQAAELIGRIVRAPSRRPASGRDFGPTDLMRLPSNGPPLRGIDVSH